MGKDGAKQARAEMVLSSVLVDNEYVPYTVQNSSNISKRLFHQLYCVHVLVHYRHDIILWSDFMHQ